MILDLDSVDDARVGDYRAIPDPALLTDRGLFIAEGRLVVERLLDQDRFPVRSLLVNRAALASLDGPLARRPDLPVFVADTGMLSAIGGFDFHRGCLAVGERTRPLALDAIVAPSAPGDLVVVAEGLAQADNVGSLFRNAAAFGARAVLLDPATCDPLYRKAIRTSLGTTLTLPFTRLAPGLADLERLRTWGYRLVALTPRTEAVALEPFAARLPADRLALVIGSEGHGLSDALLAAADNRVRIPMHGAVDSLNVATATGIALYRLRAALDAAGRY